MTTSNHVLLYLKTEEAEQESREDSHDESDDHDDQQVPDINDERPRPDFGILPDVKYSCNQ